MLNYAQNNFRVTSCCALDIFVWEDVVGNGDLISE